MMNTHLGGGLNIKISPLPELMMNTHLGGHLNIKISLPELMMNTHLWGCLNIKISSLPELMMNTHLGGCLNIKISPLPELMNTHQGGCLNIKISSYQYMVSKLSYLNKRNPHTWKASLYIKTGPRSIYASSDLNRSIHTDGSDGYRNTIYCIIIINVMT